MSQRFLQARAKFVNALARFEEALAVPRTAPLAIDGSIQRFEFTLEMAWRAIKHAAAREGMDTVSPRQAVEAGFALGLIEDEAAWVLMLRERNETTHTYREEVADAVYARLPGHLSQFAALARKLAAINPEP